MDSGQSRYASIVGFMTVMLMAGGCAQTSRAPDIADSGFLGADYALLKPGKPDQAQLVYLRPGVEWSRYRKILLDSVTVWQGKESAGRGISAHDEQMLVNYFYSVIHGALEKEGFTLVTSPDMPSEFRDKSISAMEWLGRYSMTDVMVLALMIFYINASGYTEASVLPGIYFFAASTLMTMLSYGWANSVTPGVRDAKGPASLQARLAELSSSARPRRKLAS